MKIGEICKDLKLFDPSDGETWYVIDKDVPHEFYPEEQDITVISFHTCLSNELIEIECGSGKNVYMKENKVIATAPSILQQTCCS